MAVFTYPAQAILYADNTGLAATLTYKVVSAAGATLIAQTSPGAGGISERGATGTYVAGIASFDESWSGYIEWFNGTTLVYQESFIPSGAAGSGGGSGSSSTVPVRVLSYPLYHYGVGGVPRSVTINAGTAFLTLKQSGVIKFGPVAALVTPAGAATAHTLSYRLPGTDTVPNGTYDEQWDRSEDGDAQAPIVLEDVLISSSADYAGIYPWVRLRLGKSEAQLPDSDAGMIRQTGAVVSALLSERGITLSNGRTLSASCLAASYAEIENADLPLFDQAAGILVAARLGFGVVGGAAASGVLKREKSSLTEREYSTPPASHAYSQEGWEAEAVGLLLGFECIRDAEAAKVAGYTITGLASRTRANTGCSPCSVRGYPYRP